MSSEFTISVIGDAKINRRISVVTEPRFLDLIKIVRGADIAFAHLETLIHDYDGPEVYPTAEPGNTWMRSPRFITEELKWAGIDIVSHAGNHSMDYGYGGLYSTWQALDEAGIPHAGTGRNLGDARAPAYLETPGGRVALISMCSSFSGPARAGEVRPDVRGRPGLNPLRFYYQADSQTLKRIEDVFALLGYVTKRKGDMLLVNPAGMALTQTKFIERAKTGITTVVDEDDAEGNLRAIRDARRQADWVIVHLHNHWCDFDPERGHVVSSKFVTPFAHACIDAGGDVFIEQGAMRGPLRGVDVYKGRPIFYNTGDFIRMSKTVTRQPADFFLRAGFPPEARSWKATPADGYDVRESLTSLAQRSATPEPVSGAVLAVCAFGEGKKLTWVKLYPITHVESPRSQSGIPRLADAEAGKKLIDYLAMTSSYFGTRVKWEGGVGIVRL